MSADPNRTNPNRPWVDPLLVNKGGAERRRGLIAGVVVAIVLYALFLLFLSAIKVDIEDRLTEKNNLVEVDFREMEPEPEPVPEPPPEEEPEELVDDPEPKGEEEVPPEPEPKPEPEPEPEPKPKPKPKPTPEPEPEKDEPPPSQKAPDDSPPEAKEAMDAVNLEGLDESQFADNADAPAFKVGMGIESGKTNKEFVDPSRFGKIQTAPGGKGQGYSDKDSDGKGKAQPVAGKKCPTRQAKILKKFRGKYTAAAKRRSIEGNVIGLLTVDTNGRVTDVKIVKSLGSGLDESATAAFKQFLFKPAEKNCKKVASKVRISHTFTIER